MDIASKIAMEIPVATARLAVVNGIPFVDQTESLTPIHAVSVMKDVTTTKPSQLLTKDFAVRLYFIIKNN